MNLINLLALLAENYDYKKFLILVGSIFALAIVCIVILVLHNRHLKKKDKHLN